MREAIPLATKRVVFLADSKVYKKILRSKKHILYVNLVLTLDKLVPDLLNIFYHLYVYLNVNTQCTH
jgi:hypothetical protein